MFPAYWLHYTMFSLQSKGNYCIIALHLLIKFYCIAINSSRFNRGAIALIFYFKIILRNKNYYNRGLSNPPIPPLYLFYFYCMSRKQLRMDCHLTVLLFFFSKFNSVLINSLYNVYIFLLTAANHLKSTDFLCYNNKNIC